MLMFSTSLSPRSPFLCPASPYPMASGHSHPDGYTSGIFRLSMFKDAILLSPPKPVFILHCQSQLVIMYLGSQARVRRPLLTSLVPSFKSLTQSYQLCFLKIPPPQLLLPVMAPFLQYSKTFLIAPVQCPFQSTHHTAAKGIFSKTCM